MEYKIEKILIATDGSEYTEKAIEYGLSLAKLLGAKVYALCVADIAPALSVPLEGSLRPVLELIKNECMEATSEVRERGEKIGVEVECVVREGKPASEIVKFAEENEIDLIVMGTLGRGGLERILLGSVAERVIRTSKVPVVVVRGET
ncbi:universal stress protein [Methanosarcinales archaeon]|nr:MAG: universal stress protein [Methanosarcinales archaeon]